MRGAFEHRGKGMICRRIRYQCPIGTTVDSSRGHTTTEDLGNEEQRQRPEDARAVPTSSAGVCRPAARESRCNGGYGTALLHPGPDAVLHVVYLRVTRSLSQECADFPGAVSAAADENDRLARLRDPVRARQPRRRVRMAFLVEKSEWMAAGKDPRLLPFRGCPDVDHGHAGGHQPRKLRAADVDHLGAGSKACHRQAKKGEESSHGRKNPLVIRAVSGRSYEPRTRNKVLVGVPDTGAVRDGLAEPRMTDFVRSWTGSRYPFDNLSRNGVSGRPRTSHYRPEGAGFGCAALARSAACSSARCCASAESASSNGRFWSSSSR